MNDFITYRETNIKNIYIKNKKNIVFDHSNYYPQLLGQIDDKSHNLITLSCPTVNKRLRLSSISIETILCLAS